MELYFIQKIQQFIPYYNLVPLEKTSLLEKSTVRNLYRSPL